MSAFNEELAPGAAGLDWLERHGDTLYAYAIRRVNSAEIAEELVQETFLGAIRNNAGFARDSSEETWLIGILRNKLVDHYRRKNRVESLASLAQSNGDTGDQTKGDPAGFRSSKTESDPASALEQEELKTVMRECIEDLPDLARQAFEFRILEHMETSEVCKLLGISSNNLAARMYRARMYVRDCLTHRWF
ncbi:ECF RNA polymerase sigma factor SigH [Rubripirellula obstinata]|uniref:RNA polymerase sigma factor n=1 Tax=Rubripirellula obstinata TaxID=406547 RepID=A0A5B1CNM2_9BACT|nr:sigma-70 family RNA polymerase sigma factor [Rubripirellula obstinata]KAA1261891.1 ECF RNA polymerase sigma factor SigH [Rubripirellula obstinata]